MLLLQRSAPARHCQPQKTGGRKPDQPQGQRTDEGLHRREWRARQRQRDPARQPDPESPRGQRRRPAAHDSRYTFFGSWHRWRSARRRRILERRSQRGRWAQPIGVRPRDAAPRERIRTGPRRRNARNPPINRNRHRALLESPGARGCNAAISKAAMTLGGSSGASPARRKHCCCAPL